MQPTSKIGISPQSVSEIVVPLLSFCESRLVRLVVEQILFAAFQRVLDLFRNGVILSRQLVELSQFRGAAQFVGLSLQSLKLVVGVGHVFGDRLNWEYLTRKISHKRI